MEPALNFNSLSLLKLIYLSLSLLLVCLYNCFAATPAGSYKASDTGLVQVKSISLHRFVSNVGFVFPSKSLCVPSLNELRGRRHIVIVRGKSIMFIKTWMLGVPAATSCNRAPLVLISFANLLPAVLCSQWMMRPLRGRGKVTICTGGVHSIVVS